MLLVTSTLSDRGLKRSGNEDSCFINETLGYLIVFDAMEGCASVERTKASLRNRSRPTRPVRSRLATWDRCYE